MRFISLWHVAVSVAILTDPSETSNLEELTDSALFAHEHAVDCTYEEFILLQTSLKHERLNSTESNSRNHDVSSAYKRIQRIILMAPFPTSIQCVVVLANVVILLHTFLAVARNVDELAGRDDPSNFTQTLMVAQRKLAKASIMCSLFVACRMHINATTENRGEPQTWVKACMILATVATVVQVLVVLLLPFLANRPAGMSLLHSLGDHFDPSVRLDAYVFASPFVEKCAKAMVALCGICIYGGTIGVGVGMFQYQQPWLPSKEWPSPGFIAVALLTCIFLVSCFLVSASHFQQEHRLETTVAKIHTTDIYRKAFVSVSMAARKIPMIAILFLTTRQIAMVLDPPNGKPPRWVQKWFYIIVIAVIAELIAAAMVGAYGRQEIKPHRSFAYIFHARRWMHILQYSVELFVYVCLLHVFKATVGMTTPDGEWQSWSASFYCLSGFILLYFACQAGFMVTQFVDHVLGIKSSIRWMLQSVFLSATSIISTCPSICVLILAARMRALQLTDGKGASQNWAQEAMYVVLFATMVETFCYSAIPFFLNVHTGIDKDGEIDFNTHDTLGAYIVSLMQYIAFTAKYGGLAAISLSVYTLTADVAAKSAATINDLDDQIKGFIYTSLWISFAVPFAMIFASARIVGLAVKMAVERVKLGVEIKIGTAAISICGGYVTLSGVQVQNPRSDHTFSSPCLINIRTAVLYLDLWALLVSWGKRFLINTIVLNGVDINYEKTSSNCNASSNVSVLMRALSGKKKKGRCQNVKRMIFFPCPRHGRSNSIEKKKKEEHEEGGTSRKNEQPDKNKTEVKVTTLVVEKVAANIMQSGHGALMRLQLADIRYDNFQGLLTEKKGDVATDVVKQVLRIVLQAVIGSPKLMAQWLKGRASSCALSVCSQRQSSVMKAEKHPTDERIDDSESEEHVL